MKGIKKLLTGILAATMIMGMSITAFAGENTITIERDTASYGQGKEVTNGKKDPDPAALIQDYTAYKILSVEISGTDSKTYLYYTDTDAKKTALVGTGLFNAVKGDVEGKWYISLNQEADAIKGKSEADQGLAVAAALDGIKTSFPSKTVKTADENNAVFTGMEDGYYLITSTLGSNLIVKTFGGEVVSVKEKNEYPTIDKKQRDDDLLPKDAYTDDSVNVKVGDVIDYQITVKVPAKTSKEIIVTDTMSAGLTLDPDSIEVTGYGEGTAAVVNGQTFTVTLPVNTGDKDSTTITFKATINSSALTETGKKNEVTLDYGNYHQYDSVPYEIYKTGIFKYDGATNAALKGAKFSLTAGGTALTFTKKADTETTYVVDPNGTDVLTSGEDGTIYIEGIDYDKELVLTETEAPANYNLLTDSVSIAANPYVVKMTDSLVLAGLFKVANNVGSILPSTGGIGTTIFYIVGAVLIIAGVAYFIVRRKANAQ